jgi:hypothetical protein
LCSGPLFCFAPHREQLWHRRRVRAEAQPTEPVLCLHGEPTDCSRQASVATRSTALSSLQIYDVVRFKKEVLAFLDTEEKQRDYTLTLGE